MTRGAVATVASVMPATPAASGAGQGAWPSYAPDEIAAAMRVLGSGRVNYWTGEEGRAFEREYATHVGVRHGVAMMNGTVALEAALRALGIGPGDEVVVTPRSFFASVSTVVMAGARPVFADVDAESQNITADTIEAVLTPRTRAVMPVHLAGWPCDMPAIMAQARGRGLLVIEDCAQANGARVGGRMAGSFGQINIFSFCQDKIITTGGEGGLVVTDDEALWRSVWSAKDHGKSWQAVYAREHGPGFRWLHEGLGSNWRMTEMQAAIGRVQLGKLEGWLARRRRNAGILIGRLGELAALRVPTPPPGTEHAWYKLYVFVRPQALKAGWDRDRIMQEIAARGIFCGSGSCPEIYREKAIRDLGLAPAGRLPVARELGETSLMLLVHPTLDDNAMHETADIVEAVVRDATR
jgi:dTDP-4-amino-4,6-dideoxygalactose transaminase